MGIIIGLSLLIFSIAGLVFGIHVLLTPSDVWERNHKITKKISNEEDVTQEIIDGLVVRNTFGSRQYRLSDLAMDKNRDYGR